MKRIDALWFEHSVERAMRRVMRPDLIMPLDPAPRDPEPRRPRAKRWEGCEVCGWIPPPCFLMPGSVLHDHHILPKSAGGGDEEANRICLCPNCHRIVHAAISKVDMRTTPENYQGPRTREDLIDRLDDILDGAL